MQMLKSSYFTQNWKYLRLKPHAFVNSIFSYSQDLPNNIHKIFRGQIDGTVELKVPGGNVWQVSVIKSTGNLTFQSGWKDFVIANCVEENDLLVFKYSGNSSFQAQISDPNGCERTSFFAQREEIEVQESSDNSTKIFEGPDHNMYADKITISGSSSDSEFSIGSAAVRMPQRKSR
jgi:B3 DNA binding domain